MNKLILENLISYKNKCGIYKITINNKIYIGSSKNIKNRLNTHLKTLKNKTHHNHTMQNLYNKYGDEIYFEIMEECLENILLIREKYYIDLLKPYINHILDPISLKRDYITKKRVKNKQKEYYKNHTPVNIKTVYMYDLDGKYLNTYESITKAANINKLNVSAICACCNKRKHSAGNFRWSYQKLDKLAKENKNYKKVAVVQMDLKGNIIKIWESKKEAETKLKISNISRSIKKCTTAGGFTWKKF